jgi:AcrR family transcriptional regulator
VTTDPAGAAAVPAREALRRAAERSFAAHGIEGVSLRQITRDAGQRNTTALQYHFGSREGLLLAVLRHHLDDVVTRRAELLERYRAHHPGGGTGPEALRELADALVLPLCAQLDRAPGGPEFLQVAAEVVNRSDWMFAEGSPIAVVIGAAGEWGDLAEPWLSADAAGRLHRRFAAMRFVHVELGRRARQARRRDDRLFASQLTDLVAALLTAPVSPRTEALLRERPGPG